MLTEPCNAEGVPGDHVNALTGLLRQASIEKTEADQLADVLRPRTSPKKVRGRPASADTDLPESPTKMIRTLVSDSELA